MKRFWLKSLLLLPFPLLVVGFTWWIDPVHLRNTNQYEFGIARLVLQGKNVTNISHPNEAAYLTFYVDGLQSRKDVLVLGSSRSKLIRSDVFAGVSFFNNSIGGAGLVDYLTIYQMYRQKGLVPSVVVLELSPWVLMRDYSSIYPTLNAQKRELEEQALSPTAPPIRPIQVRNTVPIKFAEFLSPGYFQTSFFTWLRRVSKPSTAKESYFAWTGDTVPMGETLMADGSAIYPERVLDPEVRQRVLAQAIEYGQKPIGIPVALDPACQRVLEGFVDELVRDGVHPVLYLPPYHPRAYALMVASEQNRIILEEQRYFEALARERRLTLVGSYNPADLSLDETAFLDGSHPMENAVRGIFLGHVSTTLASSTVHHDAAERIELMGISNRNGLEEVDGRPFFWIGNGDTCLKIRSTRAGTALITFHAGAGPSLPETQQRNLFLQVAHEYSRSIQIKQYPEVSISFPVRQGVNDVCLTPLDKPTVLKASNGDMRPLLMGVSNLQVKLLPANAQPPDRTVFSFQFTSGWHSVERHGPDWLCWNDGHGRLSVQAETNATAILSGEILSVPRPNHVDLTVNGEKVKTLVIDWTEWAFRSFEPVPVALKPGQNSIEFVSEKPPVVQEADHRPLAVAVKNLSFTEVYSP